MRSDSDHALSIYMSPVHSVSYPHPPVPPSPSPAMLLVASVFFFSVFFVFKQVSCRRAAAAAFQETVGRQGGHAVPHGIRIVTTADFAALGSLRHSFLTVALALARLPEYRAPSWRGSRPRLATG